MSKNKKCQFKSKIIKDYICPEPSLGGSNYCIFHKPDKTEPQAKLFQKKIKEKLQKEDYDFIGFRFPKKTSFARKVFDKPTHFTESTFEGDADFRGAVFEQHAWFRKSIFKGRASFDRSTFQADADFRGSTFNWHAEFMELTVKKDAIFARSTFIRFANFTESIFKEYAGFPGSTFKEWAYFKDTTFGFPDFKRSTFEGPAIFRGSTFKDPGVCCNFEESVFEMEADFEGLTFKNWLTIFRGSTFKAVANFEGSIFKGARFDKSTFERLANFKGSAFEGNTYFEDSVFEMNANFEASIFKGYTYFKGSIFEEDALFKNVTFRDNLSAEKVFRIVKSCYQKQGDYTRAGEYYYKERIAKRKQLPWYSPKRWLEYILLDGLCGYGERPLRAIRTGLGVLFGLAFLYWKVGHIYPSPELFNEPHTLTFLDALYFSVVTFTTLGFGDWRPDPSHWIRYVVMSEAFIGAFLMALFIVTFARRMMR